MDNYRLLLERAARLYDKHEAGRPESFNVFSVLRSGSDEVNLHSRFLHALLDYKKPGHETRENLADFLRHVGVENFEQHGVEVRREHDNIDILITNDSKVRQAVVVENKIWSGDQPEQLQRYHNALMRRGYDSDKIKLLYLTPHGDGPSKESIGNLDCTPISYKADLPSWLERCQQRAYDEPGLRESVAQYCQLVRKLTGTDFEGAYVNDLTKLVLEGGNLALVHDLNEAMIQAKIHLQQKLWSEIDAALHAEIACLPPIDDTRSDHASERNVRHFFIGSRNRYHGLFYQLGGGAFLGVSSEGDRLIFGVTCFRDEHPTRYAELREELANVAGGVDSVWWPWYQWAVGGWDLKNPARDDLRRLLNQKDRMEYARGIAQGLIPVWEAIQQAGLIGQNP